MAMNTRPQRYYIRGRHATSSATPRQIGPCLFCDSMGHLIKDWAKLKVAKQEQKKSKQNKCYVSNMNLQC